ncbi:MAG: phosphoesterase [Campylobacterales bacterium]|nr:phosphoesterase [Campylobacterales bacterium]
MSKVHHLSHIDLDGYGCQYLTSQNFSDITFYNANYGPEVQARLKEIITTIENMQESDVLILITDLNLTPKEAKWIERKAHNLGAEILLLDHHITGKQCAQEHVWYILDTNFSATKLTYDWLKEKFAFDLENNYEKLVDSIDAVDMWRSKHTLFEFGKVMMSMIAGAKEIGRVMFPKQEVNYMHYFVDESYRFIDEPQSHIILDDNLYAIKKDFFLIDHTDTKDNLVARYINALLSEHKESYTIYYKEYQGVLGYSIGSSSIIGNKFLVENSDYNFYMDINFRGQFSLRGNGTLDLSEVAQIIGNGGGHPNASGGKIEGLKDSFVYNDIKQFVQGHIDQKIISSLVL